MLFEKDYLVQLQNNTHIYIVGIMIIYILTYNNINTGNIHIKVETRCSYFLRKINGSIITGITSYIIM